MLKRAGVVIVAVLELLDVDVCSSGCFVASC